MFKFKKKKKFVTANLDNGKITIWLEDIASVKYISYELTISYKGGFVQTMNLPNYSIAELDNLYQSIIDEINS